VQDFQYSPSAEEALVIMAQSYDRLGLNDLRDDAQRVLAKNFPNSRFASEGLSTRQRQWWQFW
jgi:outer membrane protein assembly factor BamD